MDEFEVMRRQMAAMKEQLDTQQIINKELMRKVMRGSASWMNVLVKSEFVILPIIFLFLVVLCYIYDISQWYSFTFLIFGGIDTVLDLRTIRIPNSLFSSTPVIEIKRYLVRQKKERFIQTCIMGVLCIGWLSLFINAVSCSNLFFFSDKSTDKFDVWGLILTSIGISLIVIIILYKKMQRTNDRILADIDELEKE